MCKIIKPRNIVHNEVPPGEKSNAYMLVDNNRTKTTLNQIKSVSFVTLAGYGLTKRETRVNLLTT